MKNLFLIFAHILVAIAKLLRPNGARALVAENLALKQQASDHQPLQTPGAKSHAF